MFKGIGCLRILSQNQEAFELVVPALCEVSNTEVRMGAAFAFLSDIDITFA
jgi:hypothetical protein